MPSAPNDKSTLPPPVAPDSVEDIDDSTMESNSSDTSKDQKILPDGMKLGLAFSSKEKAVEAVLEWCDATCTPFTKKIDPGTVDFGGDKCGRIQFICSHAIKRPYRGCDHRPLQRVNYTGCTSRVNVCQQRDSGFWKVTTVKLGFLESNHCKNNQNLKINNILAKISCRRKISVYRMGAWVFCRLQIWPKIDL